MSRDNAVGYGQRDRLGRSGWRLASQFNVDFVIAVWHLGLASKLGTHPLSITSHSVRRTFETAIFQKAALCAAAVLLLRYCYPAAHFSLALCRFASTFHPGNPGNPWFIPHFLFCRAEA
ncbi:MAG TPA: hypothetical protein VGO67_17250 [Verrucomicrobiae bacterium]